MKILNWKIWVPVMVVCMIGFGLTGQGTYAPKEKSQTQIEIPKKEFKSRPRLKTGPGKGGKMYDLEVPQAELAPPPPPPPVPEKSNTLANIFFYGSGVSILLNLLNFLEKITALIGKLFKKNVRNPNN